MFLREAIQMEIYNLMEDYVKHAIKVLLEDKEDICKCEQCRYLLLSGNENADRTSRNTF